MNTVLAKMEVCMAWTPGRKELTGFINVLRSHIYVLEVLIGTGLLKA
jgi:hypothetical protein